MHYSIRQSENGHQWFVEQITEENGIETQRIVKVLYHKEDAIKHLDKITTTILGG